MTAERGISKQRQDSSEVVLEARGIVKEFGHVQALRGASLQVRRGEIVALVGDNGAGKSTLLKIMCGALAPDGGELEIGGEPVEWDSVRDAHERGVEAVYQDLALAPDLTVPENIFVGHELLSRRWQRLGVIDRKRMARDSAEALERLGVQLPVLDTKVRDLSGGQRQAVAVARASRWASTAILMDEPTAALGVRQTEIVVDSMRAAAASGLALLVISHDVPRMLSTANRIAVMRLGTVVTTLQARDATIPQIVGLMLGTDSSGDVRV
jgi:simple sugar transport system ATP-binding protein